MDRRDKERTPKPETDNGAVVEEMTGSRPRLAEEDVYSWDD